MRGVLNPIWMFYFFPSDLGNCLLWYPWLDFHSFAVYLSSFIFMEVWFWFLDCGSKFLGAMIMLIYYFFLLLIILIQFSCQSYPNYWYSFFFVHWVYLQCFKSNFPRFFFPTPIFFSKMSICLLTFPPKVADFSIYIIDFCIHFVDFPPRFLSSLSKLLITSNCLWPLSGHWSFLLAH